LCAGSRLIGLLNSLPRYYKANSECHARDYPYEGGERRPVECLAPGEAGAKENQPRQSPGWQMGSGLPFLLLLFHVFSQ